MSKTARFVLFLLWVVGVTLCCIASIYLSEFLVLPVLFNWAFRPRESYKRELSTREIILVAAVGLAWISLLAVTVSSDASIASNQWFREHTEVKVALACLFWIVFMTVGVYSYANNRFLAQIANHSR